MHLCALCGTSFPLTQATRVYCTELCEKKGWDRRKRARLKSIKNSANLRKCGNCNATFEAKVHNQLYCSVRCCQRVTRLAKHSRKMIVKAKNGSIDVNRSRNWRSPYTSVEIAALRADPLCILPHRTLRSQWKKCCELDIRRDKSLKCIFKRSVEARARYGKSVRNPENERRARFRRSIRRKPELVLAELRKFAHGHPYAEDIVIEGFATVLHLAIPPAEAFALAKAEVGRTSAQPFREQSFDPDTNYDARETGRQVARTSDIRAARGDGG